MRADTLYIFPPPGSAFMIEDDTTIMINTEVDTILCTTKIVNAPTDTILDDDILFNLQDCDSVFTIGSISMVGGPHPDTTFMWYRPCDEGGHLYTEE
jgi:hypothetical protein